MHHPKSLQHQPAGEDRRPYWKRAHTDWRFWVALVLMFLAMGIYVATNDLSWRPRAFYTRTSK